MEEVYLKHFNLFDSTPVNINVPEHFLDNFVQQKCHETNRFQIESVCNLINNFFCFFLHFDPFHFFLLTNLRQKLQQINLLRKLRKISEENLKNGGFCFQKLLLSLEFHCQKALNKMFYPCGNSFKLIILKKFSIMTFREYHDENVFQSIFRVTSILRWGGGEPKEPSL